MELSKRAIQLRPSPLQEMVTKAKSLKDVISLEVGEPGFPSPASANDAARLAINANFTKYTSASGIADLREAAAYDFRKSGIPADTNNTIIGPGAKPLIPATLWAICDPCDEILIPGPYYPPFWDLVQDFGATPVLVDTRQDGFVLRGERLKKAINKKTKAVILNSPNNPTGILWDWRELDGVCDNLLLISDESYYKILFGKPYISIASLPGRAERTITIRSCSKSFAMTGWRIGYLTGPEYIVKKIQPYLEMAVGCPCSVSQKAALKALVVSSDYAEDTILSVLDVRRKYLMTWLKAENIPFAEPSGAFYVFPDFSQYKKSSLALANFLLENAKVAVTPGIAFGPYDDFLRISYASLPIENLPEALERIGSALDSL